MAAPAHVARGNRIRLQPRTRWRALTFLGIALVLVVIGTIAVLSGRASSLKDTIVSVASVNGGFLNGIQAIDSRSGTVYGSLTIDVPRLDGCAASQPKAYLGDMTVDQSRGLLYIGLKPCAGGTLPADRAIAIVDLKRVATQGFLPGPSNPVVVTSADAAVIYAVRGDGLEVAVINTQSRSVIQKHTATSPISRAGLDEKTGDLVITLVNGAVERVSVSGARTAFAQAAADFPLTPQAQDNNRVIMAGDAVYALGKQGSQWGLVRVASSGTTFMALQSEPVSLASTKTGEYLFIMTACASGVSCVAHPNRMYGYSVTTGKLQTVGQDDFFPLQQAGSMVRLNADNDRIFFDGVVSGASGMSQRFVFPLDANGALPSGARVAVPAAEWAVATLGDEGALSSPVSSPSAAPDIPAGGGVGVNTGAITTTPVPIDQIERILGVSIRDINFDRVTDEQIRAFGYDPATVRRAVAQYKLSVAQTAVGQGQSSSLCSGTSAGSGVDLTKIERTLGVPLSQLDFSQISDDQIRQLGYDPATVRQYVAQSKASSTGSDTCANVFTQDGFVSSTKLDASTLAAGSAANVTADANFDITKGGWVITVRWQAPGGAEKFRLYGRDNDKHQLEQQLAVVDRYVREASFGGFSQLALSPISDRTYWFSVVPELTGAKLGTPAAVKTRVRCVLWCVAEPVK